MKFISAKMAQANQMLKRKVVYLTVNNKRYKFTETIELVNPRVTGMIDLTQEDDNQANPATNQSNSTINQADSTSNDPIPAQINQSVSIPTNAANDQAISATINRSVNNQANAIANRFVNNQVNNRPVSNWRSSINYQPYLLAHRPNYSPTFYRSGFHASRQTTYQRSPSTYQRSPPVQPRTPPSSPQPPRSPNFSPYRSP